MTMMETLEQNLSERMKKFVPANLDLTDFESERLSKQLDLETVRITLNRDS